MSEKQPKSKTQKMLLQLVAGGLAGSVTKTCIAPLERTKILFQLQGMNRKHGDPIKYKGILNTMRIVVKEEGVRGLYKGNGANVVRIIPTYGLKFAFNDTFKDMVRKPGQPLAKRELLMSGTLAGLFQITCTYPLEVVRTRLSLSEGLKVGEGVKYNGIVDCFRKTVQVEGASALYKGLVATWVSGAPYVGMQMTFYQVMKDLSPKKPDGSTAVQWSLVCGALSGLAAQTATYPGDTIRRRMQTNGIGGSTRLYTGTWSCVTNLYQMEGIVGFYRGLGTNVVRCIPGAAIQFFAYDSFKKLLDVEN